MILAINQMPFVGFEYSKISFVAAALPCTPLESFECCPRPCSSCFMARKGRGGIMGRVRVEGKGGQGRNRREVSNTSESKAMNITALAVYKLRDCIRHGEQMSVKMGPEEPQRVRR